MDNFFKKIRRQEEIEKINQELTVYNNLIESIEEKSFFHLSKKIRDNFEELRRLDNRAKHQPIPKLCGEDMWIHSSKNNNRFNLIELDEKHDDRSVFERMLAAIASITSKINRETKDITRDQLQQAKEERRKLREALKQFGQHLNKKRNKLLRIKRTLLKKAYSKNKYIDLRESIRRVVKDISPSLDDEDDSFLNENVQNKSRGMYLLGSELSTLIPLRNGQKITYKCY